MEAQTRSPGYIDDKEALLNRTRRIADGGGNVARHNGDRRQCTHVSCR